MLSSWNFEEALVEVKSSESFDSNSESAVVSRVSPVVRRVSPVMSRSP